MISSESAKPGQGDSCSMLNVRVSMKTDTDHENRLTILPEHQQQILMLQCHRRSSQDQNFDQENLLVQEYPRFES